MRCEDEAMPIQNQGKAVAEADVSRIAKRLQGHSLIDARPDPAGGRRSAPSDSTPSVVVWHRDQSNGRRP
jgi:hypothetical protein